jgi:uncharacterized protein (TIGR02646 family)
MIRITRGTEPTKLGDIRNAQLAVLRALGREPTAKEINGYSIVAEDLWKAQHHKCCYCEQRIPKSFNDVEHYRPKTVAARQPGSNDTHGYWWLAFTWENLLFACPACNRSNKNSKFPLAEGSSALIAEDLLPGQERPLLLDPGSTLNPVEHIEFIYTTVGLAGTPKHWWARPRNNSLLGNFTIDICGLNSSEQRELREDHYNQIVTPQTRAINAAVTSADIPRLTQEFHRALGLIQPRNVFVGLTYDALRMDAPDADIRKLIGTGWPSPDLVAS